MNMKVLAAGALACMAITASPTAHAHEPAGYSAERYRAVPLYRHAPQRHRAYRARPYYYERDRRWDRPPRRAAHGQWRHGRQHVYVAPRRHRHHAPAMRYVARHYRDRYRYCGDHGGWFAIGDLHFYID